MKVSKIFKKNKILPYNLAMIYQLIVQIWLIVAYILELNRLNPQPSHFYYSFSAICFPGAILGLIIVILSFSYMDKYKDERYWVCIHSVLIGTIFAIGAALFVLVRG
ncbi:MAG: hypothetical protein JSV56_04685 [Methanomassiliicoccales archaeon]|nr:MAG: hypothetical protein JSV56_04685 [Methanomassiliicoccales archaeon]